MQTQQTQSIKLEVNLEDVNLMLASLAKQPYEAVFRTVEKVRNQAEKQVNSSSDSTDSSEE